jgi:hypothetical protein
VASASPAGRDLGLGEADIAGAVRSTGMARFNVAQAWPFPNPATIR